MKLKIKQHTPAYWQVTIDNPPINLFDNDLVNELQDLLTQLENSNDVKVVVFDSADPDFFLAHVDLLRIQEPRGVGAVTGMSPWPDFAYRLERAPFLTIGLLRGIARGVGSEFLQALDIRFASKEKAILAQIELGCGIIPGGGGLDRLPLITGRARAMEIIMGSQDFDADTAALYGWVNRSIPDAELDAFVEKYAKRVASFDKRNIASAKAIINKRAGIVTQDDLEQTQADFFKTLDYPETRSLLGSLVSRGLQTRDFELNLEGHLGPQDN